MYCWVISQVEIVCLIFLSLILSFTQNLTLVKLYDITHISFQINFLKLIIILYMTNFYQRDREGNKEIESRSSLKRFIILYTRNSLNYILYSILQGAVLQFQYSLLSPYLFNETFNYLSNSCKLQETNFGCTCEFSFRQSLGNLSKIDDLIH